MLVVYGFSVSGSIEIDIETLGVDVNDTDELDDAIRDYINENISLETDADDVSLDVIEILEDED